MEVWERQALLDARTLDGKTALAIATIRGSLQIVSHLGACGAAADTPDAVTGSAPVHWAGAPPPPRGLANACTGPLRRAPWQGRVCSQADDSMPCVCLTVVALRCIGYSNE